FSRTSRGPSKGGHHVQKEPDTTSEEATMSHRLRVGTIVVLFAVLGCFGRGGLRAQNKPLTTAQPTVRGLVTTHLSEVGLSGTNVAQRVTIGAGTKMADHTHTGRTSLLIMTQGALTEFRGTATHEYKAGDVIQISEGTTHHVENYGTVPAIYIEINT